jgi:hypothetical protein
MVIPAVASGAQYYKVGDNVTFAYSLTSVLATPTAVDVYVSCSANQEIYTINKNQTMKLGNATNTITWDTSVYNTQAVQLLTESYTLIIFDAESSFSAAPEPGYLSPYETTFGMYLPQAYTPLSEGFQCATCSGALSDMERKALGFMFGMGMITVLSFSWFMGGLNIIW